MGRRDYGAPLVTVVKLSGVLQAAVGPARGPAARRLLNLDRVERWFERAFSPALKPAAVAVAVNSPGGSAVQADLIYRLIRRLAKQHGVPVWTFAEARGGRLAGARGSERLAVNSLRPAAAPSASHTRIRPPTHPLPPATGLGGVGRVLADVRWR